MEEDGLMSLVDLCLLCVCRNVEAVCVEHEDGSLQFRACPVFPHALSDLLLRAMADEGVLNDRTIGVFENTERLRLKRACIYSSRLSAAAFHRALCPHRLQELDASRLCGDLTVSDILQGLSSNKDCRQGLHRLSITTADLFRDASEPILSFSTLRGLRSLCLAWTPLDNSALEDICSLPLLESLDISGTSITDLTPLLNLRSHLYSLTLHGMHHLTMPAADLLSVFSKLELLRRLDVSNDRLETDSEGLVRQLLERPGIFPTLVALDVSGWRGVSDDVVQAFVEARNGMKFVGLLATGAGSSEFFLEEGKLKVAGEWSLTQLREALTRYRERESFLREVLLYLYNSVDVEPQPAILKLVCSAMRVHSQSASLHLVATACVFKLTSLDAALTMPLSLLGNAVQQLLLAMRNFPKNEQIQKNCLFALSNEHILQVPFNRKEAVQQVMMSLACHEDPMMQRVCVGVVSLLSSKLSEEEIAQLGVYEFLIKQLLSVVQQRAMEGTVDSTLKFALSALWNLTDERPSTCRLFLKYQGLELYMELLETYFSDLTVQKKVLGLLNNLAEVEALRTQLMEEDLLEYVLDLLRNPAVEVSVSYFAGGILANLTSTRGPPWGLDPQLRDTILNKLHSSVLSWTAPEQGMVSYQSLQPFYPLLHHSQPSGVQLWALWGIYFICQKEEYCKMLVEEGGMDILRVLMTNEDIHKDVRALAVKTLSLVEPGQACASPAEDPCV